MNLVTKLRMNFEAAMYKARVYRGEAEKDKSTRVFWLRNALEEYQRARIIRKQLHLEMKHPVRNDFERMSVRSGT